MNFEGFGLKPQILQALTKVGYVSPTPIQEAVLGAFISGKNIVGQSQTGSGKTAAFCLPILNLIDEKVRKPQALILAPTRELVAQIHEEIYQLSHFMRILSMSAYGGSSFFLQKEKLKKGAQIIVGTPGRIIDLIERKVLDTSSIRYLVLDEVDRMLDMGFVDDVDFIRGSCKKLVQSMTFSATLNDGLKNIVTKYLGVDYTFLKIHTEVVVDRIDHGFVDVPHFEKFDMLLRYLDSHSDDKIIIFTQTKRDVAELAERLEEKGYNVGQMQGDLDQRKRFAILNAYKANKIKILIATDVAARGINVKDITLVINYSVPLDAESYVHRIGRTARAGKTGKAVMFVSPDETKSLHHIERTNKITIKKVDEQGKEVERDIHAERVNARSSLRGGRGGSGGRSYRPSSSGGLYKRRKNGSSDRGASENYREGVHHKQGRDERRSFHDKSKTRQRDGGYRSDTRLHAGRTGLSRSSASKKRIYA